MKKLKLFIALMTGIIKAKANMVRYLNKKRAEMNGVKGIMMQFYIAIMVLLCVAEFTTWNLITVTWMVLRTKSSTINDEYISASKKEMENLLEGIEELW